MGKGVCLSLAFLKSFLSETEHAGNQHPGNSIQGAAGILGSREHPSLSFLFFFLIFFPYFKTNVQRSERLFLNGKLVQPV